MTEEPFRNIAACVFDAYGTLFDVNAATAHCRDELGDQTDALSRTWRTKQLQYTWWRGLMGKHTDFARVTADALDYAMETVGVTGQPLRDRLLDLYMHLDAYQEVGEVLTRLKDAGLKTAILSNGSPKMLAAAVSSAGLDGLFDAVLSVEEVGVFKPHPSVYRLGEERLNLPAVEMSFQSANSWDAVAASAFGYQVAWVNRFGQPREQLPWQPQAEIASLSELPGLLGLEP